MQTYSRSVALLVVLALLHTAVALPSIRVKREDELALNDQSADLNPIESEDNSNSGLDREKRKLPEAAFGAKNAVIGFVFTGGKASAQGSAQASAQRSGLTTARPSTTTDDTPDFDRNNVSVDIPDQLFSNSFTTVTRISQTVGDFMMNTARRYAQFIRLFKPLLGKALIVKGYNPPRTTTTTQKP